MDNVEQDGGISLDTIKNVRILQRQKGYRFSIDALLLADFVNPKNPRHIADFGAGSGIIGILLAQKYPAAFVHLIELQKGLYELANKNVALNNVTERIKMHHLNINDIYGNISSNTFDLAVSNPPYRKLQSGELNPDDEKAAARHELNLTLDELIKAAFYVLRAKGRFSFIYQTSRFVEVIETLRGRNFEPRRVRFIYANAKSEAKIFLIEAVKEGRAQLKLDPPFFVYDDTGRYSAKTLEILST
ncbi:tRNA1(Val) (adenine(37)-N6)-methyltransferase [Candidatus Magnetominusculus xianensis]|uniref:tRNA1(Val) (Adenine(37)-N6)-methyltransferase n=1 Tax=Candidatus Magnetominusculus xianensis TaxID=1748249 RepID=A0ABR5SCN7_9BACT|nr:tRNA1(Val) (adenine(37)-N6)-methyltransferase [Candidatus Magnetominusculus xianensis]KWT82057.1 tRNA1(Val) (adenine(37)-N6)-methyltransferase [Candidatus Magnetominusculus xianensis]MBF0405651.1 tRNA1(Val) (adenine(37)-N6)-methyltransferase [Nitrospirota bacterium]